MGALPRRTRLLFGGFDARQPGFGLSQRGVALARLARRFFLLAGLAGLARLITFLMNRLGRRIVADARDEAT